MPISACSKQVLANKTQKSGRKIGKRVLWASPAGKHGEACGNDQGACEGVIPPKAVYRDKEIQPEEKQQPRFLFYRSGHKIMEVAMS